MALDRHSLWFGTLATSGSLALAFSLSACGSKGNGDIDAGDGNGNGDNIDAMVSRDSSDLDCDAPDMLILLDRTMSMHRKPDNSRPAADNAAERAKSKWSIAVNAIHDLTGSLDTTLRFGLTLFPLDPGGEICVTLGERIENQTATNEDCQAGELIVSPAIDTGPAIASALSVTETRLCNTTPIGAGLSTAKTTLADIQVATRDQYLVLITDGADTCDDKLAIDTVQDLAVAGVKTLVIGFGGAGVDKQMLNHLACAGGTSPAFPSGCTEVSPGRFEASNPGGAALFALAEDAEELSSTLAAFATEVCCGCVD